MRTRDRQLRMMGIAAAVLVLVGAAWMVRSSWNEGAAAGPKGDGVAVSGGAVSPLDGSGEGVDPGNEDTVFSNGLDARLHASAPPGQDPNLAVERRVRVVEEEGPFPFIRYEDDLALDPETAEPVTVRSVGMLADHVAIAVPEDGDLDRIREAIEDLGYTVARAQTFSAVWQIGLGRHDAGAVPEAIAAISRALPEVTVEPDYIYRPQSVPDDYDPVPLWGLKKIEAPAAWSVSRGSDEVVVAIIDSGAELVHRDLAANLWVNPGEIDGNGLDDDGNGLIDDIHGWDFVTGDNRPDDNGRHGTHVSGTVGAVGDNAFGVVGVNWNTRLIIIRVGDTTFPNSAIINAIDYVTDLRKAGVNVVVTNNSYGGFGSSSLQKASIEKSRDAGILFVAAAGNDGLDIDRPGNATFPANYDVENVITVASSNLADELSIFSNYGAVEADLAAPGSAIRSSIPGNTHGYLSGTSMASPHVAGAIALLKAVEPDLDWVGLRDRLFATVDTVPGLLGRVATGGRLNLRKLVGLEGDRLVAEITAPGTDLVLVDAPGTLLDLSGSSGVDGPDTAVSWSTVLGPAQAVFSDSEAPTTSVSFPVEGLYRLRFTATTAFEASNDEITVAVGPATSPSAGLVGFWQFEESAGSTAVDASGRGRTGSLSKVTREVGPFGQTARFNGEDSSVSFASPVTNAITVSAWVRSDSLGESIFPRILNTPDYIFYFGRRTGDVDADINSIKFFATKTVQDGIWHTRTNAIGDGKWVHVAVSYDGSSADNFPTIFLDGKVMPVGVDARSGDQARGVVGNQTLTPGTAYIGENEEGTRAWDGLIDEVRIYSRALNRAEIAWIAGESALQPLLAAGVSTPAGPKPGELLTVTLGEPGGLPGGRISWDQPTGSDLVLVDGLSSRAVTFFAPTGGTKILRVSASRDGVTVVRNVELSVETGIRPQSGLFSGAFLGAGEDGVIQAFVGEDGRARFLGQSTGGGSSFVAEDVGISPDGTYEFVASDGTVVRGQFDQEGFSGVTLDGGLSFSGGRTTSGGEGEPIVLVGSVANSENGRLVTWLGEAGNIQMIVSGLGSDESVAGQIAADGSFLLQGSAGSSVSGLLDLENLAVSGTIDRDGQADSFYLADKSRFAGERLANISTRGLVGVGDAVMIAGFVVEGGGTARALIRGVGPGLVGFELPNQAGATELILVEADRELATNRGWKSGPQAASIEAVSAVVGAFPLVSDTGDSALLTDLGSGVFTATLSNPLLDGGPALLEIYDASAEGGMRLVNLSTRGWAGLDSEALIAGFVLADEVPRRVLIRGIGPGLADFGVGNRVADPRIELFAGNERIAVNEDWEADGSRALLQEVTQQVGAFPLLEGSGDAALTRFLEPGLYTVRVESADGLPGVALVEIYVVPDPDR